MRIGLENIVSLGKTYPTVARLVEESQAYIVASIK